MDIFKSPKIITYFIFIIKVAPLLALTRIGYTFLAALMPTFQIQFVAQFIDKVIMYMSGDATLKIVNMLLFFIFLCVLVIGMEQPLSGLLNSKMLVKIRETLNVSFIVKQSKIDYAYIENSNTWNLISRINKDIDI